MVTVVDHEETEWGNVIRVSVSDEMTVYFAGFDKRDAYMRGLVFKNLYERCGGCDVLEKGAIPTEVACMGKAAIASYLYSAHRQPVEDIAERLDVSPGTVEQYLSDFRHGRR